MSEGYKKSKFLILRSLIVPIEDYFAKLMKKKGWSYFSTNEDENTPTIRYIFKNSDRKLITSFSFGFEHRIILSIIEGRKTLATINLGKLNLSDDERIIQTKLAEELEKLVL